MVWKKAKQAGICLSRSLIKSGEAGLSGTLQILTMESSKEVYQYEYPVDLGSGEETEKEYYIPLGVGNDQMFLTLTDQDGNEIVKKG